MAAAAWRGGGEVVGLLTHLALLSHLDISIVVVFVVVFVVAVTDAIAQIASTIGDVVLAFLDRVFRCHVVLGECHVALV